MAFNNLAIQKLVNNSIQFKNGMTAIWPNRDSMQFEVRVNFRFSEYNGCFSVDNGVLGFIIDNALYVTPLKEWMTETLESAGFEETSFRVPFSVGDYPKDQAEQWKSLMKS